MSVTALVCTRGRPELLGDCLRSLVAALPPGGELLVVAYEDEGAEELVTSLGPAARYLRAPVGGKSRQLNQGLRSASHDVVVLTDDDCRVDAGWVAAMAAPFAEPEVGVVFGDVQGLSAVRGAPQPPRLAPGEPPPVTWQYANGAAMAVRKAAVVAVGGFDERLGPGAPVHGEEHDLVLRLCEAGWRPWIADAPPVEHLEWRDAAATRENLVVYSRGAGAFLGAAIRRDPRRWTRTAVRRLRYQLLLWRSSDEDRWFGPATTWAFLTGLVHGLRLGPRRYL